MPSLALLRWAAAGIYRMWRPERHTITVRVDPGSPTVGIWCNDCKVPSVVSVPLSTVLDDGVLSLGEFIACTECEPEWFGTDDQGGESSDEPR